MSVTIYHNPKCSKSRQTLEMLRGEGVEPTIVEYLNDMPDAGTLDGIVEMLGVPTRDIVRSKEAAEEGIDANLDGDALIAAIAAHPRVLQRPIVVNGDKAAIGRPPENVLAIL